MTTHQQPKVSVLMITYNHERFIAQAIASALMQQTDFDYEIVIGEDCSTDRTREIVKAFQRQYPERIRLLLPVQNLGVNENLAQTLRACRGQYVAILEGDDYWISCHKLQKQADFLDAHPECTSCFHPVIWFDDDEKRTPWVRPGKNQRKISTIKDLMYANPSHTSSVMFRCRLFGEFPDWFYTITLADWAINVLNTQHGWMGYIDEIMSKYRIHSGGIWSLKQGIWVHQERIKVIEAINAHLQYQYNHILSTRTAEQYFYLANFYKRSGNIVQARVAFHRCFKKCLISGKVTPKNLISMFLRLYISPLYALLRTGKQVIMTLVPTHAQRKTA